MVNELDRYFDAIVFFELGESLTVTALVVCTKNKIDAENKKLIYSVGYFVKPKYRKQGLGSRTVQQALLEVRFFLISLAQAKTLGQMNYSGMF